MLGPVIIRTNPLLSSSSSNSKSQSATHLTQSAAFPSLPVGGIEEPKHPYRGKCRFSQPKHCLIHVFFSVPALCGTVAEDITHHHNAPSRAAAPSPPMCNMQLSSTLARCSQRDSESSIYPSSPQTPVYSYRGSSVSPTPVAAADVPIHSTMRSWEKNLCWSFATSIKHPCERMITGCNWC